MDCLPFTGDDLPQNILFKLSGGCGSNPPSPYLEGVIVLSFNELILLRDKYLIDIGCSHPLAYIAHPKFKPEFIRLIENHTGTTGIIEVNQLNGINIYFDKKCKSDRVYIMPEDEFLKWERE